MGTQRHDVEPLSNSKTLGPHSGVLGRKTRPAPRNSKERVQVVNHPNFNRGGGTAVVAALLSRKYPVFPLWSRDWTDEGGKAHKSKSPATANGFHDATRDVAVIRRQFLDRGRPLLIGVPTGRASGILLLDVDPQGQAWLDQNRETLPVTRTHKTRRGLHFIYRMPDEPLSGGKASELAPGVDIKADGGYMVWWPATGLPVENAETISDAPMWLLERVRKFKANTRGKQDNGAVTVRRAGAVATRTVHEGGRNDSLAAEAGAMRRRGFDPEAIHAALAVLNTQRCVPPLDDEEVRRISYGMARYAPAAAADLRLRTDGKGNAIADEDNVGRILEHDTSLLGAIRFDELRAERILSRPLPDQNGNVVGERGIPRPWRDSDSVKVQQYVQRRYFPRISLGRIEPSIDLYARERAAFHPVRDYLQGLQWDGVKRLDTLLRDFFGAQTEPEEYLAAVGAKFLIAAVARVMEPGCQVDSALVLEGLQGIGKSSALRILAGDEWFSDSLPADLAHKDARDHLRGKWIVELPELAQFKRSEIESVKAFLSRRFESYRPAYGRLEVTFPRQCVFAGTTNSAGYLNDTTGNRRFWTVACGRTVDLATLRRERDQLWAEAAARYRAGEHWHLTGELAETAAVVAQARVQHDPWTADVARVLVDIAAGDSVTTKPVSGSGHVEVSPGEIMARMALSAGERNANSAKRIGQILLELGGAQGKRHYKRGQLYVVPMKHEAA